MRLRRVAAHEENGLGITDIVVAVRHRAEAPGIGYAGNGGGVTDTRLMIGIVGPPKGGELAVEVGGLVGELGRAQPVNRVRSRLLANLQQPVADLVNRLVPGNAGPLAVHELHRVAQAALVHHVVANRGALTAMRSTIDGAVVVRFLTDPHAIGDFGDDRTADRAMGAEILASYNRGPRGRWRTGFRFAYRAERQIAERRKSSCGEAGALQKRATIGAGV